MNKIIIESDDVDTTTHTRIDLTEYTEMVIKLVMDSIKDYIIEEAKRIAEERKK